MKGNKMVSLFFCPNDVIKSSKFKKKILYMSANIQKEDNGKRYCT